MVGSASSLCPEGLLYYTSIVNSGSPVTPTLLTPRSHLRPHPPGPAVTGPRCVAAFLEGHSSLGFQETAVASLGLCASGHSFLIFL